MMYGLICAVVLAVPVDAPKEPQVEGWYHWVETFGEIQMSGMVCIRRSETRHDVFWVMMYTDNDGKFEGVAKIDGEFIWISDRYDINKYSIEVVRGMTRIVRVDGKLTLEFMKPLQPKKVEAGKSEK